MMQNRSTKTERELVITRLFSAPRELVWKAWTEPERVKRWWGPKDFTAPVINIDLRVGGEYLYCMRSPESKDYWSKGVYREIVPLERIVATDSFADEKGNVVPATYYGLSPDFPLELLLTVLFEDYEGGTKITLKHAGLPPGADQENTQVGWNESLDKLAENLAQGKLTNITAEPGGQEVVIIRVFDAPRELVFKTNTDPALVPRWWGPKNLTTRVDKMDVRPGGVWRFVQRDAEGNEYAFHGVYHDTVPPERLVYTFEFEGMPGHVSFETVTFEEQDGKTKVTDKSLFQTVEDRDEALKSEMEEGASETMDRFAELLKEKQK